MDRDDFGLGDVAALAEGDGCRLRGDRGALDDGVAFRRETAEDLLCDLQPTVSLDELPGRGHVLVLAQHVGNGDAGAAVVVGRDRLGVGVKFEIGSSASPLAFTHSDVAVAAATAASAAGGINRSGGRSSLGRSVVHARHRLTR